MADNESTNRRRRRFAPRISLRTLLVLVWHVLLDVPGVQALCRLPNLEILQIRPHGVESKEAFQELKKMPSLKDLEMPMDQQSMQELTAAIPQLQIYSD